MIETIRQERIDKYGSFLYCPEWDTICSFRDTEDGTCGRTECLYEDPEWLKLQERIEERRKNRVTIPEEPQTNIRTQNRTDADILKESIWRKEAEARKCYTKGWTRKGDRLTYEIVRLRGKLSRMGATT